MSSTTMEEILTPFTYEFVKDTDIFVNDENVDFEEVSLLFETKFQSRFPNVKVLVIKQFTSMTKFDIEFQKKAYVATRLGMEIYKDRVIVFIFLGMMNGALLAHPVHRPSFSKEWTCLSRRSILIQYPDKSQAYAICPYDDKKSYDVDAAIASVQHFLEDEVQCTCCMSNIHEVKKKILHCFHCNTFLCKECFYKCTVNKTNKCITCKQNFAVKIQTTRQDKDIKMQSVSFENISRPTTKPIPLKQIHASTCFVSEDDIQDMITKEAELDLYGMKADEFKTKLREKYGKDVLIVIPRPFSCEDDALDVCKDAMKRVQVVLRTMYMYKKTVIVVFLGTVWGRILSSKEVSKALFPDLKGAKALPRCTVLVKDTLNDVSYIYKSFMEKDPFNVDKIIEDIKHMKLKM